MMHAHLKDIQARRKAAPYHGQGKAKYEEMVKGIKRSGSAKNPWATAHSTMAKMAAKRMR